MNRADSLLKPFIRDLGIEDGVRLAKMKQNWHILFHTPLSLHMSPCLLSGSELLLTVDSPVWLQELKFYQEDIIKKLTPYEVKSVRFRLGKITKAEKSDAESRVAKVKPLTASDRSYIEETVSHMDYEALKEVVKKAIGKAIATGKTR